MSFLLKGRRIFLFVFLLAFVFSVPQYTEISLAYDGVDSTSFGASGEIDENNKGLAASIGKAISAALFSLFMTLPAFVVGFVFNLVATAILGIASVAFHLAIQIGVIGISDFVYTTDSITDTWLVFRNLANIGIIFVVIFTAITTILQLNAYDTKKQLAQTIVAALLLNFSFFFGAIVVDVSNQLALTVYEQIEKEVDNESSGDGVNLGRYFVDKTLVGAFAPEAARGVDENAEEAASKTSGDGGGAASNIDKKTETLLNDTLITTTSVIFGGISALVLAIVLFIAASMILGRLIAILILLVVSPVAFVSMILPNTKKISRDWWSSLIGNCLYLPVFLLFLYLGIKITDNIPDYTEIVKSAKVVGGNESLINTLVINVSSNIFNFAIVIGFFIAALIVAKKMSSAGSSAIGKISSTVSTGLAAGLGGAALGGAAFAGRNLIGRSADRVRQSNFMQNHANNPLVGLGIRGLDGVARSSFDARGSSAFRGVASATGVGEGVLGKAGGKDGIKGQDKWWSQQQQDYAKLLVPSKVDPEAVKTERDEKVKKLRADAGWAGAVMNPDADIKKVKELEKQAAELEKTSLDDLIKEAKETKGNDRANAYAKKIGAGAGFTEGAGFKGNAGKALNFANNWAVGDANRDASSKILKSMSAEQKAMDNIAKLLKEQTAQDKRIHNENKDKES